MPFRSKKTDAWNDTEIPAASIEHDYPTSDHLTASPSPKLSNVSTDDHTKDVPNNTAPCPTGDDIQVDNELPSLDILAKIQDYPVLDVDGKSIPFKSIYTGPNVARRVLVIFVRHFYCGVSYSPLLVFIFMLKKMKLTMNRTAKNTYASSQHPSHQKLYFPSLYRRLSLLWDVVLRL